MTSRIADVGNEPGNGADRRSRSAPQAGGFGETLAASGSLLGAVFASSCCIVPLVLFSLGASGAWIGNLAALAPYQPFFLAVAVAFLGYGLVRVYRRPATACAEAQSCARPLPRRVVKVSLWAAALLVAASAAFPYIAPALLGV